ncbi:MAG TPA: bifunctional riboflavin kinase/FAD synthetase [Bacteroidales bacterium]|nr:bifunctional riboflavin kinase/FAD synthetase [Bacteroidales bacterium]HPT22624.1 bifunctional riboflavin kinase/FAD synthetase [Bacteroidales bacterium]
MIIHKGYENLNLVAPVVTLGIFDGVHLGHRALLDRLVSYARETKGESVVITYTPHPRLVLEQNKGDFSFLTTLDEKKALLEKAEVDHLIIIEFTKEFSRITASDFIRDILVGKIGTKYLLIGYDHHLGRRGEGDFNTIKHCAELNGFRVEQIKGVCSGGEAISSSSIRDALLKGNIDKANMWLGYFYSISGTIIEGRKIGRSLGFPTANILPDYGYKLIPANGVYAVEVLYEGVKYPGMMNIGSNPTVNNDPRDKSIEVNILDFDKDIYGKKISVSFIKWLRGEKKFDSTKQLTEQIRLDMQQVRSLLK